MEPNLPDGLYVSFLLSFHFVLFCCCNVVVSKQTLNFQTFLLTQATVLEEMPPFPERESSILAKLKKKKIIPPGGDKEEKAEPAEKPTTNGQIPVASEPAVQVCIVLYRGRQKSKS